MLLTAIRCSILVSMTWVYSATKTDKTDYVDHRKYRNISSCSKPQFSAVRYEQSQYELMNE